jgi:hypothetical protein
LKKIEELDEQLKEKTQVILNSNSAWLLEEE